MPKYRGGGLHPKPHMLPTPGALPCPVAADTCISRPAYGTAVEEEGLSGFCSGGALAAAVAPHLVAWAGVLDVQRCTSRPCSGLLHFQPSRPKGFETWKMKTKEMYLPTEGPSAQPIHCPFPLTFEYKSFFFFPFFFFTLSFLTN